MMTSWFKRARQTRTPVHSEPQEAQSRKRGVTGAYRTLAVMQISAQFMLWVTLYAYDQTVQTTWQAAAVQAMPLLALFWVWRAAGRGAGAAWWGLLLLPCLMLDGALLLSVLSGYTHELIPVASHTACVIVVALVALSAPLLSRENGVAYGATALRGLLMVLFILATVFVNARGDLSRLSPLWGQGVGKTGLVALGGVGGAWGVALMFALPVAAKGQRQEALPRGKADWLWPLIPWAACALWALWHSLVWPWHSGDVLTISERLMGVARLSDSIFLFELTSLLWLLLLTVALCGCVSAGEKLILAAAGRLPRSLGALATLLPALAAVFLWPDTLANGIAPFLPWRAALSLLAGVGMCISSKGEKA